VMNMDYTYAADGMLRNSTDHQDATLDRAYSFDHASRLVGAFTGSEARSWVQTNGQSIGTVVDGPYRQSYTMDVWDNMTTKWARSFTGTYLRQQTVTHNYDAATKRISGWYYDANGSVLAGDGVYNTYDAAGRTHETTNENSLLGSFTYDGDGKLLKRFNGDAV
jgi:YD repeat-containing protein